MGTNRQDRRPQIRPGALIVDNIGVVRVLPDVPAIDRVFDYAVPESWSEDGRAAQLDVGTMVRIDLAGRRVGAWVIELDPAVDRLVELKPLAKLVGRGPDAELIDLARWAAWRWAGKAARFLGTASPRRVIKTLPRPPEQQLEATSDAMWFSPALSGAGAVLRIPPAGDRWPLIRAVVGLGNPLIITPGRATATALTERLRAESTVVALMPEAWANAAAGATVVGTRAAAFAPVSGCGAVLVLDEHDEGLVEERAPTWNARDVAIERARRLGVPCIVVSPHPSLEAQQWMAAIAPPRPMEREGWPRLEVIDRRDEPPTGGAFSATLVEHFRRADRIVCVLNRKGRSGLLACSGCGQLAQCEKCGSALAQLAAGELTCRNCHAIRPVVCPACGSTRFKNLRMGVDRVRSDLEALLRRPVAEVTASGWVEGGTDSAVVVGTEAALHQARRADLVAFLEFDQELVAPRYRATEQALALLSKAARLVGPRSRGGIVAVQTRLPESPLLEAVGAGHPEELDAASLKIRTQLGMPPVTALASVGGPVADTWVEDLRGSPGLEVIGPVEGEWIVRAGDHQTLCDGLSAAPRPPGRMRVAVDPLRV
jgi:primosomal protein N' (replication factor Y)